jgi:prolyl oligopeptidase
MGHSNGGGLMGVMLNQHPELFNAVVSENGVMDWTRNDLQHASEWVQQERGSPEIPEERAFLERVSPYQNLRSHPVMAAPFIVTSTTDDNVFPAMSRRYAAKFEAPRLPYYFYEAPEGGHGQYITAGQQALYYGLKFTYLAQRLH